MNVRQAAILRLLQEQGEQSVTGLARRLGVTAMTVRRDLDLMQRQGRLRRSHGRVALTEPGAMEFAFVGRVRRRGPQKRAIAAAVARLVQSGMVIALDTGTTTLEVAKAIAQIPRTRVITTSLPIAAALHAHEHLEVILMGGTVRRNDPDLTGAMTEQNLRSFRTDLAVLGADAATPGGVYSADMGVSRSTQAMLAGASTRVLAVDSSKLGATAFYRYATWDQFSLVYTDQGAPAEAREWLDQCGPSVTYVDSSEGT